MCAFLPNSLAVLPKYLVLWTFLQCLGYTHSPQADKFQGLIPYTPEIPVNPVDVISYNRTIHNLHSIKSSPVLLESTSLVPHSFSSCSLVSPSEKTGAVIKRSKHKQTRMIHNSHPYPGFRFWLTVWICSILASR